jgi:hypothetical protein
MKGERRARQPSRRNLELYHEIAGEGRLQVEVAARLGISQPRVAQLCRQVERWIERTLPAEVGPMVQLAAAAEPGEGGLDEKGLRLHLAIALRRLHLQKAYGPYLERFGGARGALAYGRLWAAIDAGLLPGKVAAAMPDRSCIASAVRMAEELEDLARVAQRGPLGDLASLLSSPERASPALQEPVFAI